MRLILALAMTVTVICFPVVTSACEMHNSSSSIESLKGKSPGDVYSQYHSVLEHAKDVSEVLPYWSSESAKAYELKNLTKESAKKSLGEIQKMLPEKLKIVAEKIEGDSAELTIESHEVTEADKEKLKELEDLAKAMDSSMKLEENRVYKSNIKGNVAMRLENGVWKVHKENFNSEFESDPEETKTDTKSKSKSKKS